MSRDRKIAKDWAHIAPESILLAGAGRAILLQLANPGVGYGVARHSDFAADPLKRLHGTLSYIYALSNGTPGQRKRVQRHVQRGHRPVKSTGVATVPAYDASDPQLQLWVAATLYDSARLTYDAVFPALTLADEESVYQSYSALGTALGMPAGLWPKTRADFDVYWAQQLQQLSVDDSIKDVAGELVAAKSAGASRQHHGELLAAKRAPVWVKTLMPLARFLTAGLLPPSVREMYGFNWAPPQDQLLRALFTTASVVVRITPRKIRHAPMHYYLKRIPG